MSDLIVDSDNPIIQYRIYLLFIAHDKISNQGKYEYISKNKKPEPTRNENT